MRDPDVRLLHAAADPTRLAILRTLSTQGSVSACDFECCAVGQPTVSHHLRVLREAGWVCADRHGSNITYRMCPDALSRYQQIAGELHAGPPQPVAMLARVSSRG